MPADLLTSSLCLLTAGVIVYVGWQLSAFGARFAPAVAEAIRRRKHPPISYTRRAAELEATVRALPLDVARSEAEKALAESPYLVPEERGDGVVSLAGLGPMLAEFFTRYATVCTLGEEALELERGMKVPGAPDAIHVGRFPEHGLFGAMPGSDEVVGFPKADRRFPSIWHVVVWLDRDARLLAAS